MNDKINKILEEIASETFEGLAFMFGFPEEDESSLSGKSMMFVRVGFEGAFSGRLVMAVDRQTVRELTANMLGLEGEDEEISTDDQADALKETINVICGNLLPAIGGKEAVFNIHAPEILPDASTLETLPDTGLIAIARLSIEDEPCQLSLYIDGEDPEALMKLRD